MQQVLQIVTTVGTPLALLGLLAALGFYGYSRWLKFEERRLASLPPENRTAEYEHYLKSLGMTVPESMAARERLIKLDMEQRYLLARQRMNLFAAVFAICFVSATIAFVIPRPGPPTPPKKSANLNLTVLGWDLTKSSGKSLKIKDFHNSDTTELVEQAASWVKATLDNTFTRDEPTLQVTAGVTIDPAGKNHVIDLKPEDPLRQDRFWVFSEEKGDGKKDHSLLVKSKEALTDAINQLRNKRHVLSKLMMHIDRPGYDLRLVELSVQGERQTLTLDRLPEPALTVILDGISGNEDLAERLRAQLRKVGLIVNTRVGLKLKETYEKSLEPSISPGVRLTFLRQARVDAEVTGTYKEISE